MLIVEDELLVALEVQDAVRELGGAVADTVARASDIRDSVARHAPDLVLLDLNMRGERTYAVAAELKKRGIPFVFVTAYVMLPDCPDELRDVPHVGKPVRPEDLRAAVAKVIG